MGCCFVKKFSKSYTYIEKNGKTQLKSQSQTNLKSKKKDKFVFNLLQESDYTYSTQERMSQVQRVSIKDIIKLNRKSFQDVYTYSEMFRRDLETETQVVIHKQLNAQRIARIRRRTHAPLELEQFSAMMQNIQFLDHPNIVTFHEYFIEKNHFILIFEYLKYGDLTSKFSMSRKDYTESDLAFVIKQVLEVLNYVHSHGIIHRDIRVENFLCSSKEFSSEVKLIGLISSVFTGNQRMLSKSYGSTFYRSPEMLKGKYDSKTDIWSCGVMLYFLLSGNMPFVGKTEHKISQSILRGALVFSDDVWTGVSKQAKDLIRKLLTYKPSARITAEKALKHEWLNQRDLQSRYISKQALMEMKTFRSNIKLQDAVLMYAINLLATREQKLKLMKTFKGLDINGDGKLSKDELLAGYKLIMSDDDALIVVENILKKIDDDQNGFIDYSEFVMATIDKKLILNKKNLTIVFNLIDKNNDGFLSVHELKSTFGGQNMQDELWGYTLAMIDKNQDGKIDLNEFIKLMQRFEHFE